MNQVDLKTQIGPSAYFKHAMTKNSLLQNTVSSFEQKSTDLNLNQESTAEKKFKFKKKIQENKDTYKSSKKVETKATTENKIKRLMNII
jgi:hypothetical protein